MDTLLLGGLPATTPIRPAGGVISRSQNRELINIGSCIQFSTAPGEVCKSIYKCTFFIYYY